MKVYDVNASELARRTGVGQSVINRIMHGVTTSPGVETLSPIASFFALNMAELMGEVSDTKSSRVVTNHKDAQQIPLLSWREAIDWSKTGNTKKQRKKIVTSKETSLAAFALLVEDDLDSRFSVGTLLVVEPNKKPKNRDYVIVQQADHQTATLKHYVLDGDTAYLKPIDSHLKAMKLSEKHRVIGVVVQSIFNFD